MSSSDSLPKLEFKKVYSGKDFNELTKGKVFVRFNNKTEIHNKMTYKDGLNVDILPFSPSGTCSKGGMYFCEGIYFASYCDEHVFLRFVTIPDDAQVYVESEKFKTDKFILSERVEYTHKNICSLIYKEDQVYSFIKENNYYRILKSSNFKRKFYLKCMKFGYSNVVKFAPSEKTKKCLGVAVSRDIIDIINGNKWNADDLHEFLKSVPIPLSNDILRAAVLKCFGITSYMLGFDFASLITQDEFCDLVVENAKSINDIRPVANRFHNNILLKKIIMKKAILIDKIFVKKETKEHINVLFTEEELDTLVDGSISISTIVFLYSNYVGITDKSLKNMIKKFPGFFISIDKAQLIKLYTSDDLVDLLYQSYRTNDSLIKPNEARSVVVDSDDEE